LKDFLSLLAKKMPQFRRTLNGMDLDLVLKQRILLVINGVPCADTLKAIQDGDHIQLLTPITGG
jgi:molybdopterin converting factor small subunit